MKITFIGVGFGALLVLGGCRPADPLAPVLKQAQFERELLPVLEEYCYDCHGDGASKGGLALDDYIDLEAIAADPKTWDVVVDQLRGHIMPPPKKAQPTLEVRHDLADRLEAFLHPVNCADPFPGDITLRRLNRVELSHTLSDLFGMPFDVSSMLPPDDTGYGFDTVGDTLVFSPMFMEKIVRINGQVLDEVFATAPKDSQFFVEGASFSGAQPYEEMRILSTTGNTWKKVMFKEAGEYEEADVHKTVEEGEAQSPCDE